MYKGWIKLHRSCFDHWLYQEKRPLTKREAWENILLLVNFEDKKVLINSELIDCKRGQALLSLKSWSDNFNWSIQQVRTFFKMLENDGMIKTEGLHYTTRLTVCNYETYQEVVTSQQQANNTPITDQQQAANKPPTTTKEYNNLKNVNNEKNEQELIHPPHQKNQIESTYQTCKSDTLWHERVIVKIKNDPSITNKISLNKLHEYLDLFYMKLEADGYDYKDISDFKRHFNNWLTQELKSKQNGTNTGNKSTTTTSEEMWASIKNRLERTGLGG